MEKREKYGNNAHYQEIKTAAEHNVQRSQRVEKVDFNVKFTDLHRTKASLV